MTHSNFHHYSRPVTQADSPPPAHHFPLLLVSKGSSFKGNLNEYRRLLSGRIELKKTGDVRNFRGFLNLKKDPISEKVSVDNLLVKYSQVRFTDWVIGIVVFAGADSYAHPTSSIKAKEKRRLSASVSFNKIYETQSLISVLMISFFSLIVAIIRISMACFKSLQFKGQMIPIAIDFVLTFPTYYSIVNTISFITLELAGKGNFKRAFFNSGGGRDVSTEGGNSSSPETDYTLNELTSMSDLASTTHVVFNSLRVSLRNNKTITTVCLRDRFFRVKEDESTVANDKRQQQQQQPNSHLISDMPTSLVGINDKSKPITSM